MSEHFVDPESVHDRATFVQFVESLIEDRQGAEELENRSPTYYAMGGANNWQNSSISQFLESALAGAEAQKNWGSGTAPSWRDLALFLYLGKIYE